MIHSLLSFTQNAMLLGEQSARNATRNSGAVTVTHAQLQQQHLGLHIVECPDGSKFTGVVNNQ